MGSLGGQAFAMGPSESKGGIPLGMTSAHVSALHKIDQDEMDMAYFGKRQQLKVRGLVISSKPLTPPRETSGSSRSLVRMPCPTPHIAHAFSRAVEHVDGHVGRPSWVRLSDS